MYGRIKAQEDRSGFWKCINPEHDHLQGRMFTWSDIEFIIARFPGMFEKEHFVRLTEEETIAYKKQKEEWLAEQLRGRSIQDGQGKTSN